MSATTSGDEKWKDLNITKDEVDRIGKALKDEKFRQMFVEYAEEISDPKNREIYEKEIAMMEAERGMDVQFIHPKPGHALKMNAVVPDIGDAKVFVNICQNDHLEKPSSTQKQQPNGKMGMHWSIPHSFSPMREDADHKGDKCYVYDVVFHSDTYRMSSNPSFNTMLQNTALEGLENQFGLKINRSTVKKMNNLKFKGRAEPTVMRKKKKDTNSGDDNSKKTSDTADPLSSFPYPYENGVSSEELARRRAQQVKQAQEKQDTEAKGRSDRKSQREAKLNNNNNADTRRNDDGSMIPEYTVTNQYAVDMADFSQTTSGTTMHSSHVPSALVVSIRLPELKSASQASLDVTEKTLSLESIKPVKYKLSIKLSYPVDDENGSAKFDKAKKTLVVKLPVKRDVVIKSQPQINGCSERLENGNREAGLEGIVDDKPLIEEILDTKNNEQTTTKQKCDKKSRVAERDLKCDTKIGYKCPDISFEQEDDSVTIVLNVGYVDPKSYQQKLTAENNKVEIMFETLSTSGFPTHYYTSLTFPDSMDSISKNIAAQNIVITINKRRDVNWETFKQFDSDANEQVHMFLTHQHIKEELEKLEKLSQSKTECLNNDVVIKRKTNQHLTIDLQPPNASHEDADESLISPQIVQNSLRPDIQGILKNCSSTSESSDELSHSRNSGDGLTVQTSDISPTDEQFSPRERKKSVSFSDRVEETQFKSQSTVCEMHKTLLNRRKKQRQRETRKESGEGRRRRNSSNSEYSSGDDTTQYRGGRRRRRNSSGESVGSDAGSISPREQINLPNDDQVGSEQPRIEEIPDSEQTEQLNSDDDEEEAEVAPKSALSWSDNPTEQLIEKTKCAFEFDNSVMFDLD